MEKLRIYVVLFPFVLLNSLFLLKALFHFQYSKTRQYLNCLDAELALVSEELDIYPDIKKANNLKYDAAVDVLTQAADEWNQAVRDLSLIHI